MPLPELGPPFEPAQTESSTGDLATTPIPRCSTRVSRPSDRYGFSHTSFHVTPSSIPIPSGYFEAAKHDYRRAAMIEELRALQDNHTWDVIPYPTQGKAIGCKWVYSIKLRFDGTLDRYKARLVALGNRPGWGGLLGDFCSRCQDDYSTTCPICCCISRLVSLSNGCQKCLSSW